jgi:stress response protein YsnF
MFESRLAVGAVRIFFGIKSSHARVGGGVEKNGVVVARMPGSGGVKGKGRNSKNKPGVVGSREENRILEENL